MTLKKISICTIFSAGLIYLLLPGYGSIQDFPPLPGSLKSVEPGDTTQVSNITAYFSDYRRGYVTDFYYNKFKNLGFGGFYIPPIRLNHPPEDSFGYIRDQQITTYLEEYTYPLRDSIFVNGFEPFNENNKPYKRGATHIVINNTFYKSKTTLRYYGSNVFSRIFVYIGIWILGFWLVKLTKKSFEEKIRI